MSDVKQPAALLFFHAQTGLHPGSGSALGTVDLPVQRERHTGWPTIAAPAEKGVARDACRRKTGNSPDLLAAFGPEMPEADRHAGALSFTDARILLFPVRSLRGVFAWVTCPAVLERLTRDLRLAQVAGVPSAVPAVPRDGARCASASPLLVDTQKLVLEEFEFQRAGDLEGWPQWLGANAVRDEMTRARLGTHLAILSDDDFTHFVRHATEISTRIALNYDTKTVKPGALFFQEFLPPETVLYTLVFANESRSPGHKKSAAEMLAFLRANLPPVLQLGADETIGKGLCAVNFVTS
ncbi:MAG: type III-B CRISPR module RAMP protein Cmr4 [Planctomycetota bacterium]